MRRQNAAPLPTTENGIHRPVPVGAKLLALAKRQLVIVINDHAMREVARINRAFRSQGVRVPYGAPRAWEGPTRSPLHVVHEFRVGVGNVDLQAGVPTMGISRLQ